MESLGLMTVAAGGAAGGAAGAAALAVQRSRGLQTVWVGRDAADEGAAEHQPWSTLLVPPSSDAPYAELRQAAAACMQAKAAFPDCEQSSETAAETTQRRKS